MNYSALRALSEGATGYYGGTFRDELPEFSLTEAMNMLPIICMEGHRECIAMSENQNTALVEAAVTAINTGRSMNLSPIVEASFEGVKKKIKEIFDKIKKFIRSIIDKLKLAIDKLTKSGHQLWAKYHDSKALKQDFSKADFTVSGYKFGYSGIIAKMGEWDSVDGIERLIDESIKGNEHVLPKYFKSDIGTIFTTDSEGKASGAFKRTSGDETHWKDYSDMNKGSAKPASKIVDTLKNSNAKERERNIVSKLTGISLSGEDWQSALKKKLYGEKTDIKVGKDGFTVADIGKILGGDNMLDTIKEQYVKLESTVSEYQDQLQTELDAVKETIDKNDSDDELHTSENNAMTIVSDYYSTYIGIVNQTINVISQVKSINWGMEKARYDQAKAMLGKMLSYKAPTNNADASEIDADFMMFDFDL